MKKCWKFLIPLVCWSLSACRQQASLSIPEDQAVAVLLDVHMAEAAISQLHDPLKDSLAQVYYDQIAVIHGIPRAMLDSAIVQVRRNPDLLVKVYTQMQENLEKKKIIAQ